MISQKFQLAVSQLHAGKPEVAVGLFLEIARREPRNVHAVNMLASALLLAGRLDQAHYYATRAVELAPGVAAVHATLANCLTTQGKYASALTTYERAWSKGLREVGVAESMLFCLRQMHRWVSGARLGRTSLTQFPHAPTIGAVTAECLRHVGRADEAFAVVDRVVRAHPSHYDALLARTTLLNYLEGQSPAQMCEAHRALAANLPEHRIKVGVPGAASEKHGGADALAAKSVSKVRVGLVSGDFRRHSCAWFVLPLLRAARDASEVAAESTTEGRGDASRGLEFVLYSNEATKDDVTESLRSLASGWRDIWTWNDERLVKQIRDDAIDVLVDLAGHTPGNRLRTFSMRAAPVQATWLGYPATTGLNEMDIRIVDWMTDPTSHDDATIDAGGVTGDASRDDVSQRASVERLVRLGEERDASGHQPLLCFEVPRELPDVGDGGGGVSAAANAGRSPTPNPSRGEGLQGASHGPDSVVFCCFNSLQKYNAAMLACWAEILRRVPSASMVIKAQGTNVDEVRVDLETRLREAGLAMERVRILGYAPTNESHMAMYQSCDIQLDTFPYNGATTTCESLVMGVPVVTRCGQAHASRVGASIVASVYGKGANEFVARSGEEYVKKAVALAGRVGELRAERGELRGRVLASRLCDAKRFALCFARAMTQAVMARGDSR